jgi:hypothetical protein
MGQEPGWPSTANLLYRTCKNPSIGQRSARFQKDLSLMAQTPSKIEARGTTAVAKAFFAAADEIPEAHRPAVIKAALAKIGAELKAARDKLLAAKTKAAEQKAKAAAAKAAKAAAASAKAAVPAKVPAKAKAAPATKTPVAPKVPAKAAQPSTPPAKVRRARSKPPAAPVIDPSVTNGAVTDAAP